MPGDERSATKANVGWIRAQAPGFFLVGLLVLLAISPLFPPGLPSIADAPIHLFRTMEMVSCWRDGVYIPRWAPNLAFGYGYPLFDFSPPLPYFIAGALHVAGFSLEMSIKLLAILCVAVYGLGMYLFARNILGERGGLLAAAAYIYTPFRFREILLYGGNYPQILAIGLFPWVLWAFERMMTDGRRRYVGAGALCYGALILSHNFHAFIFTPLLVLYVAVVISFPGVRGLSGREGRALDLLRRAGPPILALSLGLVLTAFFWAPALYDLQYTAAQEGYYLTRSDFRLRLLSLKDLTALPLPLDRRADNPYVPFSLGVASILLAALGVVYLLFVGLRLAWPGSPKGIQREGRREMVHLAFFLLVLLGACFMMLRPAAPLWERLPFLPYAEFPWRLMGMADLGAAFLAGGSVRLWEWGVKLRRGRFALTDFTLAASSLALILGVAVYFYPTRSFLHWGTPTLGDYIQYEVRTQNVGTTGLAEYLPRWAEEIPTSSPLVSRLQDGNRLEKLDRSTLPASVQATALTHNAVADRYHIKSGTALRATFFTFYFPGWRAFLDGEPVPIQITPPLGLMAVDVPAGEHQLLLRFGETPFRLAMDMVSAIGLMALAGWLVSGLVSERIRARGERQEGIVTTGKSLPAVKRGPGYGLLGALLTVLFVAKVGFVDHHSTWFRQESPPDQVTGIQYPMHVRLEDNVLFLGYDLIGDERVRAGELLHVRFYWQATGTIEGDYVTFIHLDAPPDNTTFATGDNYVPGDPQAQIDVPSSYWNPARYVRDEHRLVLPDDLLPIAYSLRVGLYERGTGQRLSVMPDGGEGQVGDAISLQQIHVLPARKANLAVVEDKRQYQLGENIQLLGYNLEGITSEANRIQPGQPLTVTLYWRALAPLMKDYTVFVHLLDEAGQLRSQHDGPPLNGRYPTQNWLPDQIVEDQVVVPLPPDLSTGNYRLAVGMYELASGQRLELRGEEGSVLSNAVLLEPILKLGETQ